jgi:hypothetical protein
MRKEKADEVGRAWRRWSEADARKALDELAETAESAAGFARRKGVSTQRLQYWKKRLASSETSAPAFVAVTMPSVPVSRPEIEIRVGDDVAVIMREGCDVEKVAHFVDALLRRSRGC